MVKEKVRELFSNQAPTVADLLLAGALEYAEANHPPATRRAYAR
jgi:hypothetical protein